MFCKFFSGSYVKNGLLRARVDVRRIVKGYSSNPEDRQWELGDEVDRFRLCSRDEVHQLC